MSLHRSLPLRGHRLLAGLAVGSVVLAVAGCGSDSSGDGDEGGGKVSASQQECLDKVDAYFKERGPDLPTSLPAELTPLSKPPAEGAKITALAPGSVPVAVELSGKIADAAETVGWTGEKMLYDGTVEDLTNKLLAAIDASQPGDVVTVDPPAVVPPAVEAAKDKGVLLMFGSISEPPESVPGFGGSPGGGDHYPKVGELGAYSMLRDTECDTHALFVSLPFPVLKATGDAMEKTLKDVCPDCSYTYFEIPLADIGSPAATNAVVSNLQADPSINFTYFSLGDLAVGVGPALKQAGVDVQIAGHNPNTQNLADLQNGDNTFWLGIPTGMSAYMNIDNAVRAWDSGEPVVDDTYPIPIYTTDNITTTDTVPVYPEDYQDEFKKLWLVN